MQWIRRVGRSILLRLCGDGRVVHGAVDVDVRLLPQQTNFVREDLFFF